MTARRLKMPPKDLAVVVHHYDRSGYVTTGGRRVECSYEQAVRLLNARHEYSLAAADILRTVK